MQTPFATLGIFAKWPAPGFAKTRLIPLLGPEGAAAVASQLLLKTLAWANEWQEQSPVDRNVIVWTDRGEPAQWEALLEPYGFDHRPQQGADLGEKMAFATQAHLASARHSVIVGTDTPTLGTSHLDSLLAALASHESAFIPALDGGYVMVGMSAFCPEAFHAMPWGTAEVARLTQQALTDGSRKQAWLAPEPDLDEPDDYRWAIEVGVLKPLG